MSEFSPSEAALSGFRFIGRHPLVVLAWSGLYLLAGLLTSTLVIGLAADQLAAVQQYEDLNNRDPQLAVAILPTVLWIALVYFAATLAVNSVTFSAAYRARLHPEREGLGYFKFGKDELHMAGLILILAALGLGYVLMVLFISGAVGSLGAALPGPLKVVYGILVLALSVAACVYPIVRLSFAMPMTLADGHIRLLESWKPTRGRFWPLFGAYVLSAVFVFVLFLIEWSVVAIVASAVLLATGHAPTSLKGLFQPDTSSLAAYLTPLTLLGAVLNACAGAISLAVLTGPVASAYQAFAAPPQNGVKPAAP